MKIWNRVGKSDFVLFYFFFFFLLFLDIFLDIKVNQKYILSNLLLTIPRWCYQVLIDLKNGVAVICYYEALLILVVAFLEFQCDNGGRYGRRHIG